MDGREVLFGVNGWVALASLVAATSLAAELGFRVGVRRRQAANDSLRGQVMTLQASLLGALALLLGFSFSMASSRFEIRKDLMVAEANAIGTAYLRTSIVPEPERSSLRRHFRAYADLRVAHFTAGIDRTRVQAIEGETSRLQSTIWSHMEPVAQRMPPPLASLMISATNDVIDSYGRRIAALENHVPDTILILIVVVMIVSMSLVGYGTGLGGKRSTAPTSVAVILFSSIALLVIDLDRPRRGLIRVDERPLIELRDQMQADAHADATVADRESSPSDAPRAP